MFFLFSHSQIRSFVSFSWSLFSLVDALLSFFFSGRESFFSCPLLRQFDKRKVFGYRGSNALS